MAMLADQLQRFHQAMLRRLSPAEAAAAERADAAMRTAEVARAALQPGDVAPDFALPDAGGRAVRLAELLRGGPAVLVFVRGTWCPFCTLTLRAYQDALPAIRATGGVLAAVTPEPLGACADGARRDMLDFPLLSDRANAVGERFGVVRELDPGLRPLYRRLGHDLPRVNRSGTWRIPLPASFVVAPDGRIALAHVGATAHHRLEPAAAVEAVRRLAAGPS